MKISKLQTVGFALIISVFLHTSAFAACGRSIMIADPAKHFDTKGNLQLKMVKKVMNGFESGGQFAPYKRP